MKYMRIGVVLAICFAVQSVVNADPYERLWSEDFEGYTLGDLPLQDSSWFGDGEFSSARVSNAWPFEPADSGMEVRHTVSVIDTYHLGYLLKDLSVDLAATDSQ